MTPLTRPVTRQTAEMDQRSGRLMVIRLEEGGRLVRIKAKGERRWYTLTYRQLWVMGARNRAEELKAEKIAKRKARRAGK